jgi:hypothetical protein
VAAPASAAPVTQSVVFAYTGAAQTWVVPAGVTSVTVEALGAGTPAPGHDDGAGGGRAEAPFGVTPGQTITVLVGGSGSTFDGSFEPTAGFNGGGRGFNGGGGASDIRIGGTSLSDRVLVAGGAGGAGLCSIGGLPIGGAGGGLIGLSSVSEPCGSSTPGTGGTQTGGGVNPVDSGANGAFGVGGDQLATWGPAAGGGGGWYGGAAGELNGAGGGGSGHGPAGTVFETGVRSGDGQVTISYELQGQTISFGPTPTDKVMGSAPLQADATATSGLPVTFSTGSGTTNGACTVSSTGLVTLVHAGTCQVAADQPGDSTYAPAPRQLQTFAVAKGSQAITFTSSAPAYADIGDTFSVAATGGASGNPVTFTTASPGACTVTGTTVEFTGGGTCEVRADQAGNADYLAAAHVTQTIKVRKAQEVRITSKPTLMSTLGGKYQVVANATSGLTVALAIGPATTNGACTITGTTVTLVRNGTCAITADQPGNNDWAPAPQATQTFTVTRAS